MPGVTSWEYAPIAHAGLGPDRRDLPVLRRGELELVDDVAAVDGRQVVLGPLLDPLHRPPEPPRQRDGERLLGVDVELRAEAAADVGGDDAQLRLGDPEDELQREAQDVRDLGRRPQRDLAGRARPGRARPAAPSRWGSAVAGSSVGSRRRRPRRSQPGRRRSRASRRSTRSCRTRRGRAARRPASAFSTRRPTASGS